MMIGIGLYVSFLSSSSKAAVPDAEKQKSAFIGTPEEVQQHRQALADKYLADYRMIHPDAPNEQRKLLDAAETYVNDRIAQAGETWRFDKVTGKPAL